MKTSTLVFGLIGGCALIAAIPMMMPGDGKDVVAIVPWQVENTAGGNISALGVELGRGSLAQVQSRFGERETIALFVQEDGQHSLEAYFPKAGPRGMTAKIFATLEVPEAELLALPRQAIDRDSTPEGNARFHFDKATLARFEQLPIRALTYIPDYSQMDAEFIRERFGEPDSREPIGQAGEQWFYPRLALSIVVDPDGREVFQYGRR